MKSHIRYSVLSALIILLFPVIVGFCQEAAAAEDSRKVSVPSFPYYAEITGDDVYIRSGPGTNYYNCGKLYKGDIVKVISRQFSWSRIVPPKGSFSWISKQYVIIDSANPDFGIVTGDEVRVYAGSPYREPIHSEEVQLKLNKGDKVKLMGEEAGDYYKIFPPDSAYLWVNTEYTKLTTAVVRPPETDLKIETTETKTEPQTETPAVVPTTIPLEGTELEKYYTLKKQIDVERAKPISQQDYSMIKRELTKIAENKEAGKAGRYAKYSLAQIKRLELAAEVEKTAKLQDTQLKEIYERIENAKAEKMADFQDLGKFAVIGVLKTSSVYGPEAELLHYLVVNDEGKIICYALPSGEASTVSLENLIEEKVGLVGTIETHPQTAGALVRFSEIEKIR